MINTVLSLSWFLSPATLFFFAAILSVVLASPIRQYVAAFSALLLFVLIALAPDGNSVNITFLDMTLSPLRVDAFSRSFGLIFTLSAFAAFIYGLRHSGRTEITAALVYIGSALGVVFAGDLFTLYIFWEAMAVASTFLILASKTDASMASAFRYIIVHILGGLLLLAGILLHKYDTGSIVFSGFDSMTIPVILIFLGFLVNAAAIPFSSWLPDAYPEATVFGGVVLSAFTSKTAVYTLIRGFPGWDILILIGCGMAIYGAIYAFLEHDMRRILSYGIINQVGFMLVAIGVGTPLALAGAVAHAFAHIIYKGLLFMTTGVIIQQTGERQLTRLGGLAKKMPYTFFFTVLAALSILSFPLTCGYTTKTMELVAIENAHLFIPWIILEVSAVCIFLSAGLKIIYYSFFGSERSEVNVEKAPFSMIMGMSILAIASIIIGVYPSLLYSVLPFQDAVSYMYSTFVSIYISHFESVLPKLQMTLVSTLVFFLFLPLFKPKSGRLLDIDSIYRCLTAQCYVVADRCLNAANHIINRWITIGMTSSLARFAKNGPANITAFIQSIFWFFGGVSDDEQHRRRRSLRTQFDRDAFPLGLTAISIVIVLLAVLL